MSDDLMKLLRRQYGNLTGGERHAVADRIEALEAQLAKATEVVEASGRKRGELEAKLAKAGEVLGDALDSLLFAARELDAQAYIPHDDTEMLRERCLLVKATLAALKGTPHDA